MEGDAIRNNNIVRRSEFITNDVSVTSPEQLGIRIAVTVSGNVKQLQYCSKFQPIIRIPHDKSSTVVGSQTVDCFTKKN